jgi:hypothetical protein
MVPHLDLRRSPRSASPADGFGPHAPYPAARREFLRLETYPAAASSHAGSKPASITSWRSSEHGFAVLLWVSPDAGYEAILRPDGSNLRGSGFVWGMEGGYREIDEAVTATYVGQPDLERCLRVIKGEAASGPMRN